MIDVGSNGDAVVIDGTESGSTLTNQGTIVGTIYLDDTDATLNNAGTINGYVQCGAGGQVENSGMIQGGISLQGNNAGSAVVDLSASGGIVATTHGPAITINAAFFEIDTSGEISAPEQSSGLGQDGISVDGVGTVRNYGSISATLDGIADSDVSGAVTIHNHGSITGATGVSLPLPNSAPISSSVSTPAIRSRWLDTSRRILPERII